MSAPRASVQQLQLLIEQIRPDEPLPSPCTRETHFIDHLGMQSLEMIGLTLLCEQTFEVRLFDQPGLLSRLLSVGATVDAIDQLQRAAESSAGASTRPSAMSG